MHIPTVHIHVTLQAGDRIRLSCPDHELDQTLVTLVKRVHDRAWCVAEHDLPFQDSMFENGALIERGKNANRT